MSSSIQTASGLENALRRVVETGEYQRVLAEINRGARVISISGLVIGAARALVLAALQRDTGKSALILIDARPGRRRPHAKHRALLIMYARRRGLLS